jgi:hypothetical protein
MWMAGFTALTFPADPVVKRDAASDIARGAMLSVQQGAIMNPIEVAKLLNASGLKYLFVGAHAINAYTRQPRATEDIDLVAQYPEKVRDVLLQAYPQLEVISTIVVIRMLIDGREAIDVIRPVSSKVFKASLKHGVTFKADKTLMPVPRVEALLALKFTSMISITRPVLDRQQDAVDFGRVIQATESIDLALLHSLAQLAFEGGGDKALKMVARVRAGKAIQI